MSVCGQSGQTEEDSGSEEVTATAAAVRDIYKQKPASKVVRVLTVLAYLLSVSLAAILLSVYYVCVWKPPVLQPALLLNGTEIAQRAVGHPHEYMPTGNANFTGGGDSGVNVEIESTPENTTNVPPNGTDTETTTDSLPEESATNITLPPDSSNSTYDSGNYTDIT